MGRDAEPHGRTFGILTSGRRWVSAAVLSLLGYGLGWTILSAQIPKTVAPKSKATVAHGECRLCHRAHTDGMNAGARANAGGKKAGAGASTASPLDQVCLDCHQGPSTPAKDLGASKLGLWAGTGSSHVDGPFQERARSYARLVDKGNGRKVQLKAQCDGCHDVHSKHQTSNLLPLAFDAQGKLLKVRPTSTSQVCFACHAGTEAVRFLRGDADLGALMGPSAQSGHRPGATAASRPDLPSLRTGFFSGALDCISCHDNSNPVGPRGPHTSAYAHLLKASFGREGDVATTGPRANELCFTCHDRISIEGNQSFPLHAQHISGFTGLGASKAGNRIVPGKRATGGLPAWKPLALGGGSQGSGFGQPAACATCHDAHGSVKNPALVAFDPSVVTRSSVGGISFQRTGLKQGSCTLSCHGYDHVQSRY